VNEVHVEIMTAAAVEKAEAVVIMIVEIVTMTEDMKEEMIEEIMIVETIEEETIEEEKEDLETMILNLIHAKKSIKKYIFYKPIGCLEWKHVTLPFK
jgi:hypothetical protein